MAGPLQTRSLMFARLLCTLCVISCGDSTVAMDAGTGDAGSLSPVEQAIAEAFDAEAEAARQRCDCGISCDEALSVTPEQLACIATEVSDFEFNVENWYTAYAEFTREFTACLRDSSCDLAYCQETVVPPETIQRPAPSTLETALVTCGVE